MEFDLTLAEFFTSAQEVVLCRRHGRCGEDPDNHRAEKSDIYRLIESSLKLRQLDFASCAFRFGKLFARLSAKRFYHHEGYVCRFFYLNGRYRDVRPDGPSQQELELAQVATFVIDQYFQEPSLGIRLYYVCLSPELCDNPILERKVVRAPKWNAERVKRIIEDRLHKLSTAVSLADESLPECSLEERFGSAFNPYRKCRDFCRARFHCHQYASSRVDLAATDGILLNDGHVV